MSAPVLSPAAFAALAAAAGLSSIQFWMTVPLAAVSLAEAGVPAWKIGLIGAVPWLALVLLVPLVPRLALAIGPMRTFRVGCLLGVGGAVAFAADDALWLWSVGYALCGAGIALRWIVSDALIALLSPPARRGHRVGLFETWIGITMAVGPLILVVLGTRGALPFVIGILLAAAALPLALAVRVPGAEQPHRRRPGVRATLRVAIRQSPTALIAAAACGVIEGASTKLFPVQALGLGFSQTVAAATVSVFGAGNILTQYPVGRLADRLSERRLLPMAFAVIAAAAVSLPLTATTVASYCAVLAMIGGMTGSLYTLAVIRAGHAASAADAMGVVAGLSIAYTLGSTAGPMLAGAAVSIDLVWGLPVTITATAGLGFFLARWAGPRSKQSADGRSRRVENC